MQEHAWGWEPAEYPDYECSDCLQHKDRLDDCREFFDEILCQLRSYDPLDVDNLDWLLEELGGKLGHTDRHSELPLNIRRNTGFMSPTVAAQIYIRSN